MGVAFRLMCGTSKQIIGVQGAVGVNYAIHAPIVPWYHWHLGSLKNLFIESGGDYEVRKSAESLDYENVACGGLLTQERPRPARLCDIFGYEGVVIALAVA